MHAAAASKQLLVERDRVRFLAEQMEPQRIHPTGGELQFRADMRLLVVGLVRRAPRRTDVQLQAQARRAAQRLRRRQALQLRGRGQIFGFGDLKGPNLQRRAKPEPAGDVTLGLPIGRVEIGVARDSASLAQRRIAEFRRSLHQ